MSGKTSPWAMVPVEAAIDHRLTARCYRILIVILSYRKRNTDTAAVSREYLAKRCGYNQTTVSRITTELQRLGWLEKIGDGGRGRWSTYKVTVPETVPDPDTVFDAENGVESQHRSDAETVSGPDNKRCQDLTPTKHTEGNSGNGAPSPLTEERSPVAQTWDAYATAFRQRWNDEPVRNAKVNGQLKQLVKRLGKEQAPEVAAGYCQLNGFYQQRMHSVDILLKDAETIALLVRQKLGKSSDQIDYRNGVDEDGRF